MCRKSQVVGNGGRILFTVLAFVLMGRPAGAQPFVETDPGVPTSLNPCVVWGDYDGDGDLDLLVAGLGRHDLPYTTLYRNAAGTFTDSGIFLPGLSRATAAWGDFDGDGDLDLAMTGVENNGNPTGPARTRVYRNNGATFAAVAGSFLSVFAGNVVWADYDGDGDLDLLVTGVTAATGGVAATRLYRNDAGIFTSVAHPFPDCYLGDAAWGDYDKDGDLDLVIMGTAGPGLFSGLWRNDGGSFSDAGMGLPAMDLGFAKWGDFDNDGDLDLLCGGDASTSEGPMSRIYRNDGGSFADMSAGLQSLLWSSAAWGDYDNDGDLDLALQGYDAVAQVNRTILYRDDAGTFVNTGIAFHNVFLGVMSWADYDNDGDLDLLSAGNETGADITRIYRNNTAAGNASPGAPGNLAVGFAGSVVTFSWNAGSDDHTPAIGLNYNLRVGTTPGGSDIVSPESHTTGFRSLPAPGNVTAGLLARIGPLVPGVTYYWSVQSVDGAFKGSPFAAERTFTFPVSGVPEPAPANAGTLSAWPNPFSGSIRLSYAGSGPVPARVLVFDAPGRLVRTLGTGGFNEGIVSISWDGRNDKGEETPAGVYWCRIDTPGRPILGRLVKTP